VAEKERLSAGGERTDRSGGRADEGGARSIEAGARPICGSEELSERGDGVRFEVEREGETVPAFAVRHNGQVHAYLNRCGHISMELDWNHGKFFDAGGEYLICSTHGALYAPDSGACRGGPCRGAKLAVLDVFETDGTVYLKTEG
jgi:nitrite reductase/ring-hydroxylating ferredoxin subunit